MVNISFKKDRTAYVSLKWTFGGCVSNKFLSFYFCRYDYKGLYVICLPAFLFMLGKCLKKNFLAIMRHTLMKIARVSNPSRITPFDTLSRKSVTSVVQFTVYATSIQAVPPMVSFRTFYHLWFIKGMSMYNRLLIKC